MPWQVVATGWSETGVRGDRPHLLDLGQPVWYNIGGNGRRWAAVNPFTLYNHNYKEKSSSNQGFWGDDASCDLGGTLLGLCQCVCAYCQTIRSIVCVWQSRIPLVVHTDIWTHVGEDEQGISGVFCCVETITESIHGERTESTSSAGSHYCHTGILKPLLPEFP